MADKPVGCFVLGLLLGAVIVALVCIFGFLPAEADRVTVDALNHFQPGCAAGSYVVSGDGAALHGVKIKGVMWVCLGNSWVKAVR